MKLTRQQIINIMKMEMNRLYDEAKKHPEIFDAYRDNINAAHAILTCLKKIDEMEQD